MNYTKHKKYKRLEEHNKINEVFTTDNRLLIRGLAA